MAGFMILSLMSLASIGSSMIAPLPKLPTPSSVAQLHQTPQILKGTITTLLPTPATPAPQACQHTDVAEICTATCKILAGVMEICSTQCDVTKTGLCTPTFNIRTDMLSPDPVSPIPVLPPTSTPTHIPTRIPVMPICENMADPDNAIPDYCYCTQGSSTTKVVPAKGPNPCPWTTLPITDGKPGGVFTAPPETNTDMYSFTQGYHILGCTSSVVSMEDNAAVTSCIGNTYSMGYAPHATVQIGSSTQNVGTMSSSLLFSAISSALQSVCPPPPSGTSGACTADATITGVSFPYNTTVEISKRDPAFEKRELVIETREFTAKGKAPAVENRDLILDKRSAPPLGFEEEITEIQNDGYLIIHVPISGYTSSGIRDAMIVLAAGMFAASASGKTCASYSNVQYDGRIERDLSPRQNSGSTTLCSSTEFVHVDYMNQDIDPGNPAAWLGVELEFQQPMADVLQEMFDCEEEIDGAIDIVGDFFPEMAPLLLDSQELITFSCELAMSYANLKI